MRRLSAIQLSAVFLLIGAIAPAMVAQTQIRAVGKDRTSHTPASGIYRLCPGQDQPIEHRLWCGNGRRTQRTRRPHHRRSLFLVERRDVGPARLCGRDHLLRVAFGCKERDRCRHHHRGTLERPRVWNSIALSYKDVGEIIPYRAHCCRFSGSGCASMSANKPAARTFVDFLKGKTGKKILTDAGYVVEKK